MQKPKSPKTTKKGSKKSSKKSLYFALIAILLLGLIIYANQSMMKVDTDTPLEQPCVGEECDTSVDPEPKVTLSTTEPSNIAGNLEVVPRDQVLEEQSQQANNNVLETFETQTAASALQIEGSSTISARLMPQLIEAYYRDKGDELVRKLQADPNKSQYIFKDPQQQQFAVDLGNKGSSRGFKALANKEADIAISSRKITPREAKSLQQAGLGNMTDALQEFVIGIDGISIIVHQSNPLNEISASDLQKIFSGEITNWGQLGAADKNIALYVRDEASGTEKTFDSIVMRGAKVAEAQTFTDGNALSNSVSNDAGGIGYVSYPYVNAAKALAISEGNARALRPTPFTLSTQDYPLSRRLYLYITKDAKPASIELANFVISTQGQQIVENAGFISQTVEASRIDAADLDLGMVESNSGYRALVDHAQRINTNFRFSFSNTVLDSKAQQDLERIIQLLNEKSRENKSYRLVLVGFTDNTGTECRNNGLSLQRARIVAGELANYGIKADIIEGMGSDAPVADNDTEVGREKNRRVELWLAPLDDLPKFPIRPVC